MDRDFQERFHRAGLPREPRQEGFRGWLKTWTLPIIGGVFAIAFWGVIAWAIVELVQWITSK